MSRKEGEATLELFQKPRYAQCDQPVYVNINKRQLKRSGNLRFITINSDGKVEITIYNT